MRRILRSTPIRPKQAKAATQTYLERFLECQPDTPTGLRNRAMLAVGYELLNRRSELIALQSHDITEQANGTYRVLIRRSKADPFGYGRTAYTSSKTAKILNEWLDVRGPHIPWLFCQIYQNKPIDKGLSPTTVSRVIKQSAEMAGIDKEDVKKFSGHSLRVGAAQDLLIKGFETAAIMRAGGWKSINVLARYLEHAEQNVWEP
ncbi:MAG: tyrosine-type recombinase/integrase [Donghicola eburneus]|nr:tyrosine-type recombinase/integrase [Donghicola eburneus]MCI5041809.1 tyrosine-type recombinase/integrase [Donghicola eburneus]